LTLEFAWLLELEFPTKAIAMDELEEFVVFIPLKAAL
jgi:hypothetical protein